MKEKIKITCYGEMKEFETRKEAFDFFVDCFNHCDPTSSEASRYMTIINKLLNNEENITD